MIISVASGKGGTGKTTIATSLALSIGWKVQFIDCDVEEPNAHIFLKPKIEAKIKAIIPVPEVDERVCTFCGKCREVCAFNAIAVIPPKDSAQGNLLTFSHLCHGCGSCIHFCPSNALREVEKEIGVVELGTAEAIEFVHGRLNIGEAMAPPLIRKILTYQNHSCHIVIDSPPGTSCPVVSSVKGSDYCILVTEPTPFGLNDLKLAVGVLRQMNIPFGTVINRSDLGFDKTDEYCQQEKIPVLMRIPFDRQIAAAYSRGEPLVSAFPDYRKMFKELAEKIRRMV